MEEQAGSGHSDFNVSFADIRLAHGQQITLPKPGVTVFVGPNNVGKSTVLKQMNALSVQGFSGQSFPGAPVLVEGMELQITGGAHDAQSWIEKHSRSRRGTTPRRFYRPGGGEITLDQVPHQLSSGKYGRGLNTLQPFVVYFGDPWNRISSVGPVEMRDSFEDPPAHPIHTLQDDAAIFEELNDLCMQVFKRQLTLDTLSKGVNIRIGSPSADAPRLDRITSEYRESLSALPRLEYQGDGMRSFIGLMLPLITNSYHVVLIDEPEAFLHPPQAAQLGKILGQLAKEKSMQIVVATHDKNFLSGLLLSDAEISIVRLDRPASNELTAHQLSVANLKRIWEDPVLRHTNVLDGLFHKLTVLAEGDRDCTFFSAALEHLSTQEELHFSPSDVLFVPSGGKGGLRLLIEVLSSAHVPIVASPDLDILDDKAFLKRLISSLNGNWEDFEKDYDQATLPFRQPRDKFPVSVILNSLNEVFKDRQSEIFDSGTAEEFRALLRSKESPWKALKDYGETAWNRKPAAATAAANLLAKLDNLGIVAVRVGELEGFAPTLEVKKGPEWVPAAITAGYHLQPPAQNHLRRILGL
ncbi:ATP-dependent nuclease [Streptomyces sp. NPDC091280]|uniref:ATP-dependent nuclease n=1 Tax=Streptomyces sp. NPDC091280 TaxID=3365984 RepID=UPI00381D0929